MNYELCEVDNQIIQVKGKVYRRQGEGAVLLGQYWLTEGHVGSCSQPMINCQVSWSISERDKWVTMLVEVNHCFYDVWFKVY